MFWILLRPFKTLGEFFDYDLVAHETLLWNLENYFFYPVILKTDSPISEVFFEWTEWLKTNEIDYRHKGYSEFYFTNKDDASLFKLTWAGL